jgi:hypothetical protein
MSTQQVHGVALSLVGAAELILSVGIAWSLSCFSHATRRMRRHGHRSERGIISGGCDRLLFWRQRYDGWVDNSLSCTATPCIRLRHFEMRVTNAVAFWRSWPWVTGYNHHLAPTRRASDPAVDKMHQLARERR